MTYQNIWISFETPKVEKSQTATKYNLKIKKLNNKKSWFFKCDMVIVQLKHLNGKPLLTNSKWTVKDYLQSERDISPFLQTTVNTAHIVALFFIVHCSI